MHALITGGSSGLGFHLARELKERGYEPVLIARNEEKLRVASDRLGGVDHYAMDLSRDYRRISEVMEKYEFGVVINNAGFGMYGYFPDMDPGKMMEMISLNVEALTYITHAAARRMADKGGYIMNVSSIAACHPAPRLSAYAATKSYVAHFTKSLAKELPPKIRVSYLLLGPTKTDFFKRAGMPVGNLEKIMMSPEKVARYAVDKMLKGRRRIVPGILFKLYCLMS